MKKTKSGSLRTYVNIRELNNQALSFSLATPTVKGFGVTRVINKPRGSSSSRTDIISFEKKINPRTSVGFRKTINKGQPSYFEATVTKRF